jgi:hypothetical protein
MILPHLQGRPGQQSPERGAGSLPGAEKHQHVQIHADRGRLLAREPWQHGVDGEQPAAIRHRCTAGRQYPAAPRQARRRQSLPGWST